VSVAKLASSNW